jgi:hypothetical protein
MRLALGQFALDVNDMAFARDPPLAVAFVGLVAKGDVTAIREQVRNAAAVLSVVQPRG